jgi:glutathione gamma-glutamylcysteinyltransferase
LNALHVDPCKVWKGGWRWFTEGNLDFCTRRGACQTLGLEEGAGLNLFDLRCVAKRNGAVLKIYLAEEGCDSDAFEQDSSGLDLFRSAVVEQCSSVGSPSIMITSFDRQALDQTGSGHFSPVAAYDAATDSVLVLDVARFKYPPFWVTLPLLWAAMAKNEPVSGRPRGYALVTRYEAPVVPSEGRTEDSSPASLKPPFRCCMDDGTHAFCSSVCKTPHL